MKKLDIKSIAIIILGAALVFSFIFHNIFGGKHSDDHKDEIQNLHKQNTMLMLTNDSIKKVNIKLDVDIKAINTKIEANEKEIADKEGELNLLKKKRNEVPSYVNSLNGDGVSDAFSNYLNNSKSNNHH